jgi:hypothetical protein
MVKPAVGIRDGDGRQCLATGMLQGLPAARRAQGTATGSDPADA